MLIGIGMTYSLATPHLHLLDRPGEPRRPTATSNEPSDDAFRSLAPGEQRIARALHDAQMAGDDLEPGRAPPMPPARTLDEIAGMERGGAGWNRIFKQLKAEGLIAEQTLGQVVARWTRCGSGAGASTPGSGAGLRAAP